jgi:hypothetical protein
MSEEFINKYESDLQGRLPEECLGYFKRFTLCKLDHDESVKASKGYAYFKYDYSTLPDSNIDGCKNEFTKFDKCRKDFQYRYWDLKNYVASITGQPKPFDKEEIENLSKQF